VRVLLLIVILCITPGLACAVGLPAGTILRITAWASYEADPGQMMTVEAEATVIVPQYVGSAIEANGASGATVAGAEAYIPLKVTNTGNGIDWFSLWVYSANGWQVALLRDDNGDGIHQSGEMEIIEDTSLMVAGSSRPCFARVRVPAGAKTGDVVTVIARSGIDPEKGSAEAQFTLAPPAVPPTLTVSAAPGTAYVGQTVSLTGAIAPAMACALTLSVTSPAGAVASREITTSTDGSFADTLTVYEIGSYVVRAAFAGDEGHGACSAECSVQSKPLPTCTVTGPAKPTSVSPIRFDITFSESVTGLGTGAIIVGGGRAGDLTGAGAAYVLSVIPDGDGEISCTVPADAAHNADGAGNTKSNTATATFDGTPPEVYITYPTADASCIRIGAHLVLRGTASPDTIAVTWQNETTAETGACTGTETWSAEGIPLQVGDNVVCISAADSVGQSATARMTATRLEVDENALNDAWRGYAMVSVPVIPDAIDPQAVVGFKDRKWCTYVSSPGRYTFYPDPYTFLDPPEATPGRGFCAVFDRPASVPCGTVPPQDLPATIPLRPGWNLFGQPFLTSITWDLDRIMVCNPSGTVATLRESSIVTPNAWGWQQDPRDPYVGTYYRIGDPTVDPDAAHDLPPWRAFWIYSRTNCELILPSPVSDIRASSSRGDAPLMCGPYLSACPPIPPPPEQ